MVGGEVVEVNGVKAVRLPDGRVIQKHQAFIKAMLTGWRSPYTRVTLPKWLRSLSRSFFSLPVQQVKKYKELEEKMYIGGRA